MRLPDGWPKTGLRGDKYRSCTWCGDLAVRYTLQFDSGSVAPTVGETLTGDTSGDTAIVVSVDLESGSYAAGDAAGVIEMSNGTGEDDDGYIFNDNETVSGSTGGSNMLTANGVGSRHCYGRLYPESEMYFRNGKWYCSSHGPWYYDIRDWADAEVKIMEDNT